MGDGRAAQDAIDKELARRKASQKEQRRQALKRGWNRMLRDAKKAQEVQRIR